MPLDPETLQKLVDSGAVVCLAALVIYVLRQSEVREKEMRTSFVEREKAFIATVTTLTDKYTTLQTSLVAALQANTAALSKLEQSIDDRLDAMREIIRSRP